MNEPKSLERILNEDYSKMSMWIEYVPTEEHEILDLRQQVERLKSHAKSDQNNMRLYADEARELRDTLRATIQEYADYRAYNSPTVNEAILNLLNRKETLMKIEITYCDQCKKSSETELGLKHKGWIQVEKLQIWTSNGEKQGRSNITENCYKQFCSRQCLDIWLSKIIEGALT